ncbi:DNA alkylation repair protein, partial [Candidatus Eisenbacteria bacterium]
MMAQRRLTPRKAATEMLAYLRKNANKKRAQSYQRYFKEPVDYFGLGTENMKTVKRELLERTKGSWTTKEAVQFCKLMVKDPHMESRGLGYQVV